MLLAELVATSGTVAGTRSRKAKVEALAAQTGPGSAKERAELLIDLFGAATAEQRFLRHLLTAELRHARWKGC